MRDDDHEMTAQMTAVRAEPMRGPKDWLNALSDGSCDPTSFLRAISDLGRHSPDVYWETLSLLDQYYRRGRITAAVFQDVKFRVQAAALGPEPDAPAQRAERAAPPPVQPAPPAPPAPVRPLPVAAAIESLGPATPAATAATTRVASLAAARRATIGDTVANRFQLTQLLGRGEEGTVFEALDLAMSELGSPRRVAIKLLHASISSDSDALAAFQRRFLRLQALSHPHVVRVHEFFRDGASVFFSMERLEGQSLQSLLESRNHVPLKRAHMIAIAEELRAALEYARGRGIAHGSIGIKDIFVTVNDGMRVLDFGGLDSAADVYPIAAIVYAMCAGLPTDQDRNPQEAAARGLRLRRPARLSNHEWRTLRRGLLWQSASRPHDAVAWLEQFTRARHPVNRAIAAAALAIAISIAAAAYTQPDWLVMSWMRLAESVRAAIAGSQVLATAPERAATVPVAVPMPAPQVAAPSAVKSASDRPSTAVAPAATASAPAVAPAVDAAATGPARLELAAETVEVAPGETIAHILVRRRGNLHNAVSFSWWTESGTAKPDADFVPVAPRIERLGPGADRINLNISLAGDAPHDAVKSFFVVIDDPSPGAVLGSRTVAKISLSPATQ